jgi:ribosome recycling factor
MADPKGSRASVVVDTAGVEAKNTINVTMEDVAEEDRKEIEKELEEEMAEIRRKLACFQKMRNGVIKKADMTSVSTAKVTSNLSPEDLVHMVDVSIASKYGADLT